VEARNPDSSHHSPYPSELPPGLWLALQNSKSVSLISRVVQENKDKVRFNV
jgi:hypothetical protein